MAVADVNTISVYVIVEFIHLISSEANEICTKENKKTIGPKHILEALKVSLPNNLHGP